MYSVRDDPPKEVSENLQMYDRITQRLLFARGITTPQEAEAFMKKEWVTVDPYQYKDMEKAVDRLIHAIEGGETIGIFSDYDCDGIPAAATLYSTLNAFNHKSIVYYVPDRNTEGFGLNKEGVNTMKESNATLVCVLDCGTSSPQMIKEMEECGIHTIILDHHLADHKKPDAFALINPALESNISEPHPCAAGVVYIFIQALIEKAQEKNMQTKPPIGWEKWQLDIVGLATISDMVAMHGINRQFAHYGLEVFRKSPRPGILALCDMLKMDQKRATQDDLSFLIIPRINAASRMGNAKTAFNLLTTETMEEAERLARDLTTLNEKRKTAVASMVRVAGGQAVIKKKEKKVWVFGKREWKPSLVGLVAQRVTETHSKTVFVWGQGGKEGNTVIKGSCRSKEHDLFNLMQQLPDMFAESGGHRKAGGFTLIYGAEVALEDRLNSVVQQEATEERQSQQNEEVDGEYSINEITEIFNLSKMFAPFGVENESIKIAVPKCKVYKQFRFGKNKDHVRYTFTDGTGYISAISFFSKGNEALAVEDNQTIHAVIGSVEYDARSGKPQLRVISFIR